MKQLLAGLLLLALGSCISENATEDTLTHTLSTSVKGSGTITPDSVDVMDGDAMVFHFSADTGYLMDSVLLDGVSQGVVDSLELKDIQADHTIELFARTTDTVPVAISVIGGGVVTPRADTMIRRGDSLELTFAADVTYLLDSVLVNGINQGAVESVVLPTVMDNQSVVAYMESRDMTPIVGGTDNIPASRVHPESETIALEQVPLFISFGFDDNGIADTANNGGATWIRNYLKDKTNPAGTGNEATFDGTPMRASFYMTGKYARQWTYESQTLVKAVWQDLYADGHEIGNHSTEHLMKWSSSDGVTNFNGREYSVNEWLDKEILETQDILINDVEIAATDIKGWRTPRLEWNNNLFAALIDQGFKYDCSIESDSTNDGKTAYWPFTLDDGHPLYPEVTSYPGFWEMPAYRFHIPENLRSKTDGKATMTGLDYNVMVKKDWGGYELSGEEFTEILKHTLDLRMEGNRAPMLVGLHSDIYTDEHNKNDEYSGTANARERQLAIENFVDYAIETYPEAVRIVPTIKVIDWMNDPKPLGL